MAGYMSKSDNKYLKLRGEVWWYQRRVPAQLKHKFPNQTIISESLGTTDIREARRLRDIINGRFQEQQSIVPSSNRYRFYELVRTLSEDKAKYPYAWDEPYDYDKVAKTDETFLHALTTVSGRKDQSKHYQITLNQALSVWVQQHQQSKTKDTVSKIKRATSDFLKYLNLLDIQLAEISKRQVHDYIHFMQKTYARTTVQGYISRLRSIWNYCDRISEVSGPSPFDGHAYAAGNSAKKKQPFTSTEMEWIKTNVANDDPIRRLLVELGVFTGCRISELCALRCKDIIIEDEVTAIFIEQGKTNAATRTIPLIHQLGNRVRSLKASKDDDSLLLGLETKAMSRWFSNLKTTNLSNDSAKCFHSFRVMFATAMQQAGVDELKAAALMGHKRGNTMSYGYYSRGYELQQLKEAYDQGVERIIW